MNPLFGESPSFSQATRPQPQAQTPQQTPWELARMLRSMSPRQAEEQARRRALPLKKSEDGLLHKDISTKE